MLDCRRLSSSSSPHPSISLSLSLSHFLLFYFSVLFSVCSDYLVLKMSFWLLSRFNLSSILLLHLPLWSFSLFYCFAFHWFSSFVSLLPFSARFLSLTFLYVSFCLSLVFPVVSVRLFIISVSQVISVSN